MTNETRPMPEREQEAQRMLELFRQLSPEQQQKINWILEGVTLAKSWGGVSA